METFTWKGVRIDENGKEVMMTKTFKCERVKKKKLRTPSSPVSESSPKRARRSSLGLRNGDNIPPRNISTTLKEPEKAGRFQAEEEKVQTVGVSGRTLALRVVDELIAKKTNEARNSGLPDASVTSLTQFFTDFRSHFNKNLDEGKYRVTVLTARGAHVKEEMEKIQLDALKNQLAELKREEAALEGVCKEVEAWKVETKGLIEKQNATEGEKLEEEREPVTGGLGSGVIQKLQAKLDAKFFLECEEKMAEVKKINNVVEKAQQAAKKLEAAYKKASPRNLIPGKQCLKNLLTL